MPVDLRPAESNGPAGIFSWKPQFPSFAYGFASCAVLALAIFLLRSPLPPELTNGPEPISGRTRGTPDQEALKSLRKVLLTQEESLEPNDLRIAATLNHIAAVYVAQKEYARARDYLNRALKIEEATQEEGAHLVTTLNTLAEVLQVQGETEQAQTHLRRALRIQQQLSSSQTTGHQP